MIDCTEAVHRMWGYLDNALERGPSAEFETHLEVCQRCCGELEFSRHLKEMAASTSSETLPDPLRRRIDLLLEGGGLPIEGGTAHD